uniref:L-cystatin n=1 Tax=Lygus hesperus TaxID=30085 RepID=A0A146MC00_LYGHE
MGAYGVLVLALAFVAAMSYQAEAAEFCAGCPFKQDPAKFPMHKLSKALATAQVNDGASKILSVTVQVVSGIKYTVVYESFSGKTCTASWVDAPWVKHEPIDTQISCRAKRSLGGFEDVDDSEISELEEFGNQAVNTQTNGYRKAVLKVLEAQRQVVHGMIYKAKFLVKTTSCQMEQVPEYTCMAKETAPREVCSATLFTTPYLTHGASHLEVMNIECSNMLTENFLAAPASGVSTGHDERDMAAAEKFAVHMINSQVNSLNYKGLFKVLNVEKQLKAGGNLYTFELQLRDTDCTKDDALISDKKCHFVGNTADLKCTTKVWYWPWSGLTTIVSNKCSQ